MMNLDDTMSDSCKRCREWNFWDMGDQRKYFFKVMLGDFRSRMTVPNKFVRHFRDKIPGKIKLKVSNGRTCTVMVARYLNKLVFKSGWEAFVSTHGIKMGDFLVFSYNGNFLFEVLIFDPSCCVKAPSNVARNICNHVKQKHINPIEISSDSDDHHPSQSRSSERSTTVQSKGSSQSNNKINLSSSNSHLSAFDSADDSPSEDDQETPPVTSYMFSSTAHLTRMQWMKVEKKVRTICSDIPIYGAAMIKTNITRDPCYLGFCRKYADQYLPRESQDISLQQRGKVWEGTFYVTKRNTVRVSQGWKGFASDNKLQIGDICLFEQLKNKTMLMMNVHIIRK